MVPESRLVVPAVTQCFKDQPSEIPPTVFDRHTAVLLHLKVMAIRVAVLFLLVSVASSNPGDGDILHAACTEACDDWEQWRNECVKTTCQTQAGGNDWFPCFLACWDKSRTCLAKCAETFWEVDPTCSSECLKQNDSESERRDCRQTCVVKKFLEIKKKVVPQVPGKQDQDAKAVSSK